MDKKYYTIKIKDFFTLDKYVTLFNEWSLHRMAEAEEAAFDLKDYEDFYLFANLYGVRTALACQKACQYWIGGNAYKDAVMFPQNIDDVKSFLINSIDDELILSRTDIYEKYFDIIINIKLPSNNFNHKENTHSFMLQYMTIYLWEYFYKIDNENMKGDVSEIDILDTAYTIADLFMSEYRYTQWEDNYTLQDYMFKYVAYLIKINETYIDFTKLVKDTDRMFDYFYETYS